jgi:hypothetical protein
VASAVSLSSTDDLQRGVILDTGSAVRVPIGIGRARRVFNRRRADRQLSPVKHDGLPADP